MEVPGCNCASWHVHGINTQIKYLFGAYRYGPTTKGQEFQVVVWGVNHIQYLPTRSTIYRYLVGLICPDPLSEHVHVQNIVVVPFLLNVYGLRLLQLYVQYRLHNCNNYEVHNTYTYLLPYIISCVQHTICT